MYYKHLLSVLILLLLTGAVTGNIYAQEASREKGTVIIDKEDINAIHGTNRVEVDKIEKNLLQIRNIILATPLIQNPVGYNVHYNYTIDDAKDFDLPWLTLPLSTSLFELAPLYFDNGKLKDDPESGSVVTVRVNGFVYPGTYSTTLDEIDNPEPIFFPLNGVKIDSSDKKNIILTIPGSNTVHIITNGKPLFVPYTQGQYMHDKIARDRHFLQKAENDYGQDEKNLEGIKKQMSDYSEKSRLTDIEKMMFKTDTISEKSIQNIVNVDAKAVNTWKNRLVKDERLLSSVDIGGPAYINLNKENTPADDLLFPELADRNDPGKLPLWTVNPGYIDSSLPSSAIQIMTVTFFYHPQLTVKFLKGEAVKFFEAIDYDKLEKMIVQ